VIAPDRVRALTTVSVQPQVAFELFTAKIDAWWRKSPEYRFRQGESGTLSLEPGVGGRFLERYADGSVTLIARVTVWEPGQRLVMSWKGPNLAEHESTEVEILFEAAPFGTRVTVEHRGFGKLPADHVIRHGLVGEAFARAFGGWWGELLLQLRLLAAQGKDLFDR
jgi:uncharacterized protein YndB with AHSA1/START domain